ncbi:MAG: hypothetical protein HY751_02740 [Nitrospinae bacterium]|nr:hypothetical protein [Nitrospinota bacterium]
MNVNHKVITCFIPMGNGHALLEALVGEKGITTVYLHHARGAGAKGATRRKGLARLTEKDVLTVTVPEERAEEIFAFIYERGQVNRPHGGLMFMQSPMLFMPF